MKTNKIENRAGGNATAPAGGDDGKMVVEGYAATLESPTVLFRDGETEYKEVIDRHAFDECDMGDVVFRYNHASNIVTLARTSNETLSLDVDNKGLHVRAELADVTLGRDLYTLIRRGDVSKMSFAFTVREDSYDSKTHTRRILKFDRIVDVSAVDFPAYDDTSISEARDYFAAQDRVLARNEEIKRLVLRTML